MTTNLTTSNFDEHINKKCIVDFFTSDCPSCEKFGPIFEEASNNNTEYNFYKVNLDDDLTLAERFGINHIPTVIKFEQEQVINKNTGFMNLETFEDFIKN